MRLHDDPPVGPFTPEVLTLRERPIEFRAPRTAGARNSSRPISPEILTLRDGPVLGENDLGPTGPGGVDPNDAHAKGPGRLGRNRPGTSLPGGTHAKREVLTVGPATPEVLTLSGGPKTITPGPLSPEVHSTSPLKEWPRRGRGSVSPKASGRV